VALRVAVVTAFPGKQSVVALELPEGATVQDALRKSGVAFDPRNVGIFGERVSPDARLADGDRVEVYRPLEIDPKEARRRRARLKR
jgi:hypothetical protein